MKSHSRKLRSSLWAVSLTLLSSATTIAAVSSPSSPASPASPFSQPLSAPGVDRSIASVDQAVVSTVATIALQPGINRVAFPSEGETLIGNLYLPASYQPGDQLPTVIVTGSWTTVKEQMAGRYAQELADRGYAALAFDFRYFGESGGTPRHYESPLSKVADIKNAVSFLQTVDAVDSDRIAGLGICASAGYMAVATAENDRIRSFVAIAPWLHDAALVNTIYGGEAAVQEKIAAAQAARSKFEQTGQVDYVPAISTTDPNAAMFGEFDYYLNPDRGAISAWGNQFAVMSWAAWLTFSPMPQAKDIQVPTLFIHSEQAAIPDGARQFFNNIPDSDQLIDKTIVWLPETTQFDFYDQDATVERSVTLAAEYLRSVL